MPRRSLRNQTSLNWLQADLTDEEAAKVTLIESSAFYTTGNLGYISPDRVVEYKVDNTNEFFKGSPQLNVSIKFEDRWQPGNIAGKYHFFHPTPEGEHELEIILTGPILVEDVEQGKIDPQYVTEDLSGRIIPITTEIVEQAIADTRQGLEKGHAANLSTAKKLAQVAGLESTFEQQFQQTEQYGEQLRLQRFSDPENLKKFLDHVDEVTQFDYERLGETDFPYFLEHATEITWPEELGQRAKVLLESYIGAIQERIEELEEEEQGIESRIKDTKSEKGIIMGIYSELAHRFPNQ